MLYRRNKYTFYASLNRRDFWSHHRTASIPVIAVTAFASTKDMAYFLKAGCVGCVSKPINVLSFVDDLKQILQSGTIEL